MDTKSAIIALLIAAILVCTVAAIADTGHQQNAGSVVTVTTKSPEVESITLNPDELRGRHEITISTTTY